MDMMWYRRRGLMVTPHIESVTGAIASFNSDYNKIPVNSLICNIDPIQKGEGYPSPENVRPISGRTGLKVVRSGKNLLGLLTSGDVYYNGVTASDASDQSVTLTSTSTAAWRNMTIRQLVCAGSYVISIKATASDSYTPIMSVYNSKNRIIVQTVSQDTPKSFTLSEPDVLELRFFVSGNPGAIRMVTFYDVQLELGSTATDYEPYKGNTYSVNWETEAGTVYGGYVDVVSGKLVVDHGELDLQKTAGTVQTINELTCVSLVWAPLKSGDIGDIVCSHLKFAGTTASSVTNGSITNRTANFYNLAFCLPSAFTTVAEFREWTSTNSVKVIVPLVTPIEIQLTPQEVKTLLANNIWCDSGNVTIDYWKWGK